MHGFWNAAAPGRRMLAIPRAGLAAPPQTLISTSLRGRTGLPVKIFSGADYIVEKSTNDFVKNVRIVDVRISPPSPDDPPRVAVLILYEGNEIPSAHVQGHKLDGGQPVDAPQITAGAPGRAGNDARLAIATTVPVAVWVATATLHFDEGIDEVFSVRKIRDRVVEQGIYGKKSKKTIDSNITLYCVANAEPYSRHRKLYRVKPATYRLYRTGDDAHRGRYGPIAPDPGELPDAYKHLPAWYADEYCAERG